jgi:hypothetical protein
MNSLKIFTLAVLLFAASNILAQATGAGAGANVPAGKVVKQDQQNTDPSVIPENQRGVNVEIPAAEYLPAGQPVSTNDDDNPMIVKASDKQPVSPAGSEVAVPVESTDPQNNPMIINPNPKNTK